MPLIACGINHKTAPLDVREQFVVSPACMPAMLRALLERGVANEAVILSTCNRTEIYTHTPFLTKLADWFNDQPNIANMANSIHWYWHRDYLAVRHILRVASGLDSMVLGEPQILGQMKQAFLLAEQVGAVGVELKRLLQKVCAVTKQVRSQTAIGANSVSVAYVAVNVAKHIFSDLSKAQVLLVGAGQTVELVALYLADHGVKHLLFANRSMTKAAHLAQQFYGQPIALTDIPLYLPKIDIVVSATSSPLPIFGKGMVETALKAGKRRALLMLDIAVPRDIEPEVAKLEDVYLYNMDNLQAIVQENKKSRLDAAKQAEAIIDIQARSYIKQLESQDASRTIRVFREKLEALRDSEIEKALNQLTCGKNPAWVLTEMARLLTKKILHTPSVQLRQAGFDNRVELLLAAKKLFDL